MRKLATALALATFVLVLPALSIATDYSPHEVYALDGKVSCFVRNEGFFFRQVLALVMLSLHHDKSPWEPPSLQMGSSELSGL
jgi:hypothetical protein